MLRHYKKKTSRAKHAARAMAALAALVTTGCATTTAPDGPAHMVMGDPVTPPSGAVAFCLAHSDACGAPAPSLTTAALNPARDALTSDSTGGASAAPLTAPVPIAPGAKLDAEIKPAAGPDSDSPAPLDAEGSIDRDPPVSRIEATAQILDLLETVNRDVNNRLAWSSDSETYAVEELWTLPLTLGTGIVGDCEDFALEKRQALLAQGVPAESLAIATAWSARTGAHAVLVVRLDSGDVVLDSESPWVLPWTEAPYQWRAVQSGATLMEWRAVDGQAAAS